MAARPLARGGAWWCLGGIPPRRIRRAGGRLNRGPGRIAGPDPATVRWRRGFGGRMKGVALTGLTARAAALADRLQVLGDGALFGGDPGGVVGDHAGGLPSACEHGFGGRCAAGGELGGEPDPAAMAGEAPLDAGRLGRERETAPDRLTVEAAEYQRIIGRSGPAQRPYRTGGAVLVTMSWGGRRERSDQSPAPGCRRSSPDGWRSRGSLGRGCLLLRCPRGSA